MKHTLRFAVLSDQHIDREADPASWDLAKTAFKAAVAQKVDHVILAGDTFDCASAMTRDRDKVERYLTKLGLWERDRLTIVVGNHDIFHTPHRSTGLAFVREVAKIATASAQGNYDEFCEWAGQLAHSRDRLDGDDDLYPIDKKLGHVRLWAGDTTASNTANSGNGYWNDTDDELLRNAAGVELNERRVLAIHHPPFEDDEISIMGLLNREFSLGFPRPDYRHLERFTSDAEVDAVLCGHIHAFDPNESDPDPWYWQLGNNWRCDVHMVGRSGGVHGADPCMGILEVPVTGRLRWRTVDL